MVPYKCCCFSARSAKIFHRVSLLQRTSSSDREATATNQMHSNTCNQEACGKKCSYFWFDSEVKFFFMSF